MIILTAELNDVMSKIHDRLPVVLPTGAESEWLSAGPGERAALSKPYTADDLMTYAISTRGTTPGTMTSA